MHPIERLRYVARASGADHADLVRETAGALASLGFDPAGLVTACRRIIQRHPASGPLWWLSARVLTAEDARRESWAAVQEVAEDPTAEELSYALPDEAIVTVVGWPELISEALPRRGDVQVLVIDTLGEGSGLVRRLQRADVDAVEVPVSGLGPAVRASQLVLVEGSAVGPTGFVGVAGSYPVAAVARHAGIPVWLVSGVGRALNGVLWDALVDRIVGDDPWESEDELVPIDLVDYLAASTGVTALGEGLARQVALCPDAPELTTVLGTA